MQRSRFVFLAVPMPAASDGRTSEGILWMLVSPNNRPLGRSAIYHELYAVCRQSVLDLRANAARIETIEYTVEATGQWRWRIELDRVPVAVSSRSYLRARECTYNLQRFLEAVPQADIVAGARVVRSGRQRATVQVPDPSRADGPAGYLRAAPRPTVAPQPAPSRRVVPDAG